MRPTHWPLIKVCCGIQAFHPIPLVKSLFLHYLFIFYLQAVCCDDQTHCCPEGYKCETQGGYCTKSSSLVSIVSSFRSNFVVCPDGQSQCPDGNTCCKLSSGQYGCCPLPNAVCCSDGLHCCPSGYSCDVSTGRCSKSGEQLVDLVVVQAGSADANIIPAMSLVAEGAISKANTITCPGGQYKCNDGNTCCKLPSGSYGCCPLPNVSY